MPDGRYRFPQVLGHLVIRLCRATGRQLLSEHVCKGVGSQNASVPPNASLHGSDVVRVMEIVGINDRLVEWMGGGECHSADALWARHIRGDRQSVSLWSRPLRIVGYQHRSEDVLQVRKGVVGIDVQEAACLEKIA